jgi:hypothetical protein
MASVNKVTFFTYNINSITIGCNQRVKKRFWDMCVVLYKGGVKLFVTYN